MPQKPNTARAAPSELTRALRRLHKSLVDAARNEYEQQHGPVADAGQLLQLLTKEPQFGWLHQLSELMVHIDELLDEDPISEADMRAAFLQLKILLTPSSEAGLSEFSQRYVAMLHQDPGVATAHADVRRLLTSL